MTKFIVFLVLIATAPLSSAADAQDTGGINWDLILKALGFLVAAIVAYFQLPHLNFAMRASLKMDLEILNLLDATDPSYIVVKRAVDERVKSLYSEKEKDTPGQRLERITTGIVGALWTFGFAYWTVSLNLPNFSWWSLLTGYLAFAGAGIVIMAVTGRHLSRKRTPTLEDVG